MASCNPTRYSRRQIEQAGDVLRGEISTDDEEAAEVFRIAHHWRNSHILPMTHIRRELSAKVRRVQVGAVSVSRLKRMISIRRKLRTTPLKLYQIQDIGGCRAIMKSTTEAGLLHRMYCDGNSRHAVSRHNDYILAPKIGGYRGYHVVLKFNGEDEYAAFNRHRLELQIRTELQHAWATAVEAVGLMRNENLKAGEGSAAWLRLFEIMSAEFAIEEQCPLVQNVPENTRERRTELRHLERKLEGIKILESYNQAIKRIENYRVGSSTYFLINFDRTNRSVTVSPYAGFTSGSQGYIEQERQNSREGGEGSGSAVLVEADKVTDLKAAYPNYFLDVKMFNHKLQNVIFGRKARSFHDLAWIREQLQGFKK